MTNQQPPEPFLMDCARAQDMIFDLLESTAGKTSPITTEVQTALDQHLAACDDCRAYQATLQNLSVSLLDMDDVPVPSGLEDRIMATIAESETQKSNASPLALFGSRAKRYAPLAAAVFIVAVAASVVLQMNTTHQPATNTPQVAQGRPEHPVTHASATNPTELANLPNATQTMAPNVSESALPESSSPSQTAVQPIQTRHAAKTSVPISGSQPINGQKLAYNPDNQENFPDNNPNNSPNNSNNLSPDQTKQANSGNYTVDPSSLASAIPSQNAGQQFSNTYGSESENDVYYDPVSNLVGF